VISILRIYYCSIRVQCPRAGSALWHSHLRNHIPNIHIEATKLNDGNARQLRRHIGGHEHHHHANSGRSDNETDLGVVANMTIRAARRPIESDNSTSSSRTDSNGFEAE
jgi:hypothetical protein